MNWEKIEEITGHKIVFASLVGSKAFGLEEEGHSDCDFAVYVQPGESTQYAPDGAYVFREGEQGDCFFHPVSDLMTLRGASGMGAIQTYGSVVYAAKNELSDFFEKNHGALSVLSPYHTYLAVKEEINGLLAKGDPHFLSRGARDAGFLWRYLATEKMDFVLEGDHLALYRELRGLTPPSAEDTSARLGWLTMERIKRAFLQRDSDLELFRNLQEVLKTFL